MTLEELIQSVTAEERNRDSAVLRICETIDADADLLRDWWKRYGPGSVRSLVAKLSQGSNGLKRQHHGPKIRAASGPPTTNWRDSLKGSPELALEVELPVNGRMVAIRDLTSQDIQHIEDGYRGMAHIATARAERWGRIRSRLTGPEDTVGAAVDEGRVGLQELISTSPGQPLDLTS